MVGLWGCRPLHAVVEVHRVRVWYREIRVTIVVIVLAVIAVIALWPRESEVSSSAPGLPAPNSSRAMSLPAMTAPPSPMRSPIPVRRSAWPNTNRETRGRSAPSAMRMPNSRVRRPTVYESRP